MVQKYTKTKYVGIWRNNSAKTYRASKKINGKQFSKSFKSIQDAKAWYKSFTGARSPLKILAGTHNGSNQASFREEWDVYIAINRSTWSYGTVQKYLSRAEYFFDDTLMNKRMCDLSYNFFIDYILQKKKVADYKRINFDQDLKTISSFFNFYQNGKAKQYDPLFRNPISKDHFKAGVIKASKDLIEKQKVLTLEELSDFYNYLPMNMKDLLMLQLYCAGRISEAAGVTVDCVNIKKSELLIKNVVVWDQKTKMPVELKPYPKNGHTRIAHINESFEEMLIRKLPEAKNNLLFHDGKGGLLKYRNIQNEYDKAFKKAGIKARGTHVIRYTSATLVRSYGDIDHVLGITGHKSVKMASKYGKLCDQRTIEASKNLEKAVKSLNFEL